MSECQCIKVCMSETRLTYLNFAELAFLKVTVD